VPAEGAGETLRRRLGIPRTERFLVASAGGGKVGGRLIEAVLRAVPLMDDRIPLHGHLFTGPYLEEAAFQRLRALAGPRVHVRRFSEHFPAYLAGADLSVSMGGYNTSMNVLAARVPALVWPFAQNREQRLRTRRLERVGAMTMIAGHHLRPESLATLMERKFAEGPAPAAGVNIGGAVRTAKILEKMAGV
jgi:predicted glycosyltransferase